MAEPTLSETALHSLLEDDLRRLQDLLRLRDWRITLRVVPPGPATRDGVGRYGRADHDQCEMTAEITLVRGPLRTMRETLVHELLHLPLTLASPVDGSGDTPADYLFERALNQIAGAVADLAWPQDRSGGVPTPP